MWADFYRLGTSALGRRAPIAEGHAFYVLVEAMGTDERRDGERFQEFVEAAFDGGIVADAVIAQSLKESQDFWAIRDASGELDRTLGPFTAFDISLPIGSIGRFVEECRGLMAQRWPASNAAWFGHIADSNIHICVAKQNGPADDHDLYELIYDRVGTYRGSISAEHGIGVLKRDYLDRSRTPEAIAAMRQLKRRARPQWHPESRESTALASGSPAWRHLFATNRVQVRFRIRE